MVVTRPRLWLRLVLAAVVAAVAVFGTAAPAFAQEDNDPGIAKGALGAATCGVPGLQGVGAAADMWNIPVLSEIPSCGEGLVTVAKAGAGAIGDGVKKVASNMYETMGEDWANAGVEVLKFSLGWWVAVPGLDADVFQDLSSEISEWTYTIQVAFLILSIMMLGARLALARSGAIRDTSEEGFKQLARATVIAGALSGLVVLGTRLSDGIAEWFLNGTVGSDPEALAEAMVQVALVAGPGGVALLFVIGVIGILGGLFMAFLLLMRQGLLVLAVAALPIAATAGGTKIGSTAYEKMLAWVLALLLFKPVGAFVIGISAMLFMKSAPENEDGDLMTALVGVMLLCSAALVLPALMRLIVPNVGALGGGGSGIAAAGAALAVAAKGAAMFATGGGSEAAGMGMGMGGGGNPGGDSGSGAVPPSPAPADFGQGTMPGGGSPQGGNDQQQGGSPPETGGGNPAGGQGGSPGRGEGEGSTSGGASGALVGAGLNGEFEL